MLILRENNRQTTRLDFLCGHIVYSLHVIEPRLPNDVSVDDGAYSGAGLKGRAGANAKRMHNSGFDPQLRSVHDEPTNHACQAINRFGPLLLRPLVPTSDQSTPLIITTVSSLGFSGPLIMSVGRAFPPWNISITSIYFCIKHSAFAQFVISVLQGDSSTSTCSLSLWKLSEISPSHNSLCLWFRWYHPALLAEWQIAGYAGPFSGIPRINARTLIKHCSRLLYKHIKHVNQLYWAKCLSAVWLEWTWDGGSRGGRETFSLGQAALVIFLSGTPSKDSSLSLPQFVPPPYPRKFCPEHLTMREKYLIVKYNPPCGYLSLWKAGQSRQEIYFRAGASTTSIP